MATRSRFFLWTLAALAIGVLASPVARADDSGSVSGSVLLRNSLVPVSGVSVKVSDALGMYRMASTTNKAGRFSVVGLQPGRYSGLFEKSGLDYELIGFDICPGAQTTMTALMRPPIRFISGSIDQIRRSNEQPKPLILSTSTTMVIFNQWSGTSPPHCI
jgi:hypothetical protein